MPFRIISPLTVGAQQAELGQVDDILVRGRSGEEGAELTLKAGLCQDEGAVAGGSGSLGGGSACGFAGCSGGSGAAAAGQHAQAQGRSRCQRNGLLFAFFMCTNLLKFCLTSMSLWPLPSGHNGKGNSFPMTVYSYSVHLSIMAYLI